MDTVILAAGYGRRLAGYVPQYHKPLMIWKGALVVHRADAVEELKSASKRAIRDGVEVPIGPHLAKLCPNARRITVDTVDVGIPSMLVGGDA